MELLPPDGSAADAADARDADGDAAKEPCPPGSWLCDGFDAVGFPAPGWTMDVVGDGGAVAAAPYPTAPSPPLVLLATAPANARGWLSTTRSATRSLRCELDLRVIERASSNTILVELALSGQASARYQLAIYGIGGGTGASIESAGTDPGGVPSPTVPQVMVPAFGSSWTHLAIELGIGADPKLRVRINKTLAIDGLPPGHDVAAFGTPTQQRLTIGGSSYAGTGKWVVANDNVSCQDL